MRFKPSSASPLRWQSRVDQPADGKTTPARRGPVTQDVVRLRLRRRTLVRMMGATTSAGSFPSVDAAAQPAEPPMPACHGHAGPDAGERSRRRTTSGSCRNAILVATIEPDRIAQSRRGTCAVVLPGGHMFSSLSPPVGFADAAKSFISVIAGRKAVERRRDAGPELICGSRMVLLERAVGNARSRRSTRGCRCRITKPVHRSSRTRHPKAATCCPASTRQLERGMPAPE